MSKLSDLLKARDRSMDAVTPSETAFHALNVDDDGLLTYTKVLWNSNGSIDMTDGSGFAYLGVEELVEGKTLSDVFHNYIDNNDEEVGEKILAGYDVHVTTTDVNTNNPRFVLDGLVNRGLTFVRGATYRFIVSDQSTQGFPLYISSQASGNNYSNEYLNGIVNSRTSSGGSDSDARAQTDQPLTFTVPNEAPDILYYASGNHANCYGKITIKDKDELTNLKHRKYDQVRFDNQKLTYYMNDDGFLVARYGQDYSYS